MRKKISRVLQTVIILFLISILIIPVVAFARQSSDNKVKPAISSSHREEDGASSQDCANLDVVFIVDQSWSMSAPGTQEAADPINQRKFAVDAMIDLLTGLALDQCPGTHHRMAVISYGTSARVDLNLYDINPDTAEEASALRDENGIKKQIVADNLGGNNPEAAFVKAAKLWRNEPPVDDVKGNRKKVIIFLTNGISNTKLDYVQGAEKFKDRVNDLFPYNPSLLELETCLSGLRNKSVDGFIAPEDSNKCMTLNPVDDGAYENSTYIWTVFLKPPGYQNFGDTYEKLINQYAEMSKSHGGDTIELKANSRKDVPSTFRRILSFLAGVRPVLLNCGNFAVNPYLREMRLTVYKIDPEIKITLSYSDINGIRNELTGGVPSSEKAFNLNDYYSFGPNEQYILQYPYPGIWQLTADNCDGLDMYYESVTVDTTGYQTIIPSVIPQYDVEPFYDEADKYYINYEIRDKDTGVVLQRPPQPQFWGEVQAKVTQPDGREVVYPMSWNEESQKFVSDSPVQVPVSNTYHLSIVGSTNFHEGEPAPVENNYDQVFQTPRVFFEQTDVSFEVSEVSPFKIELVTPLEGEYIGAVHGTLLQGGWNWPLSVNPIPVKARLVNAAGEPITTNLEDVLEDDVTPLSAEIDGVPSSKVNLNFNPKTGYYEGEITGFEEDGVHHLGLTLQSEFKNGFRPVSRTVESEFSRKDSFLNRAEFYRALLVALILSIILKIVICMATSINPVRGSLVFMEGASELVRFSLANPKMCGKNLRTITAKELAKYPQLGLKKIEITNVPKSRRRNQAPVASVLFNPGGSVNAHPGVRVKCWPSLKGRPYSVQLQPDVQSPHGQGGLVQCKFEYP